MTSPERPVELAALMSFNADDPLNVLNDLANSASNAAFSEDWCLDDELTSRRRTIPRPAPQAAKIPSTSKWSSTAQRRTKYLLRLEEPFETPLKLQKLAGLKRVPILKGDENSTTLFCTLDDVERRTIEDAVRKQELSLDLFFVQYSSAAPKDFSTHSPYPTLGIESTLPQHRASRSAITFAPAQDEYPVWYFFYGTLGDTSKLSQVLRVPKTLLLPCQPASVEGGKMCTWGGKYKALIDGDEVIHGEAFTIFTKEHEEALRNYETDSYEVVRCQIQLETHVVAGCTFRFVSDVDI